MAELPDSYFTLDGTSDSLFKDRGSKFFGYAFPAANEEEALGHLESLKKEHFKARHHCYAWRFGLDGNQFRANDDGEPSGTAGKPILGQIDSKGLTNVFVVVVRYFGGTLLGASGLINAYREAAALALADAPVVEKILYETVHFRTNYTVLPELVEGIKKLDIAILDEQYGEQAELAVGIRRNSVADTLLDLKAKVHKVNRSEAETLDWPAGIQYLSEDKENEHE